ncbi:hypothetical protein BDV19DRAFT_353507 [Aspergillus venezuelensis]
MTGVIRRRKAGRRERSPHLPFRGIKCILRKIDQLISLAFYFASSFAVGVTSHRWPRILPRTRAPFVVLSSWQSTQRRRPDAY